MTTSFFSLPWQRERLHVPGVRVSRPPPADRPPGEAVQEQGGGLQRQPLLRQGGGAKDNAHRWVQLSNRQEKVSL